MSLDLLSLQEEVNRLKEGNQGGNNDYLNNFVKFPEGAGAVTIRLLGPAVKGMFEREVSEQKLDATPFFIEGTHILHINVDPREKLNFKFNRDIKAKLFSVDELYTPWWYDSRMVARGK